jgi:hypothetical protein
MGRAPSCTIAVLLIVVPVGTRGYGPSLSRR